MFVVTVWNMWSLIPDAIQLVTLMLCCNLLLKPCGIQTSEPLFHSSQPAQLSLANIPFCNALYVSILF